MTINLGLVLAAIIGYAIGVFSNSVANWQVI